MEKPAKQKPGPQPEKKVKEKKPPQQTWKEQEQLVRWIEEQTPI